MPVLDAGYWMDTENKDQLLDLGAGLEGWYMPHPNVTLHARMMERYAQYPAFLDKRIDSTGFIPHHGKYQKRYRGGYLFPDFQGSLYWQINDIFALEIGNEQQFLGEGHRSMLLSDNANSFPYIKGSIQFWNLKYFHQIGLLQDINNHDPGFHVERKNMALHYLSWNISESVSLNLFEAIVWRPVDSSYHRGIDPNYFNPVIFLRPVEYSRGSADNALIGLSGKYRIHNNYTLYGQWIIDEFSLLKTLDDGTWGGKKYGVQLGFKAYDILGLKGCNFLIEYNQVRPFTYSHTNSLRNYGNNYEPLAHPLGSNFIEISTKTIYHYQNWNFSLKIINAQKGENPKDKNLGGNIYLNYDTKDSLYGHKLLQGIKTNITYFDIKASYNLIPKNGITIEGRLRGRSISNLEVKENHLFIEFGIKSILSGSETFYY